MKLTKLVLSHGVSYSRKVSESEYIHYNVGVLGWKFDTDGIVKQHLKETEGIEDIEIVHPVKSDIKGDGFLNIAKVVPYHPKHWPFLRKMNKKPKSTHMLYHKISLKAKIIRGIKEKVLKLTYGLSSGINKVLTSTLAAKLFSTKTLLNISDKTSLLLGKVYLSVRSLREPEIKVFQIHCFSLAFEENEEAAAQEAFLEKMKELDEQYKVDKVLCAPSIVSLYDEVGTGKRNYALIFFASFKKLNPEMAPNLKYFAEEGNISGWHSGDPKDKYKITKIDIGKRIGLQFNQFIKEVE